MGENLSALLWYDLELGLKGGFMDLSPMKVFKLIVSPWQLSKRLFLNCDYFSYFGLVVDGEEAG
jgi:hypothetical protein